MISELFMGTMAVIIMFGGAQDKLGGSLRLEELLHCTGRHDRRTQLRLLLIRWQRD